MTATSAADTTKSASATVTILPDGNYLVNTSGRGAVSLSIPGFAGGAFTFGIYVVSSSEFFMISTMQLSASNPIFSGPAERQSGLPFATADFKGPTVFSLSGAVGGASEVTLGRLSFDGMSQLKDEFDQNAAGTITTGNVLTGAYNVDITGRGILNLGNSNGFSETWYICAIDPNHAFLMDASTANGGMGELEPQTTLPPFNNGEITGLYLLGSGEPPLATTTLYSGAISFDGKKNASGTEDIRFASSLSMNQHLHRFRLCE